MNNPITTLSRERLEELSSDFAMEGYATEEEQQKMARALLAVMDAKPVAYTSQSNLDALSLKQEKQLEFMTGDKNIYRNPVELFSTPPAPSAPDCEWTYDESDYCWSSSCGEDWQFTDGGPEENRVKFCQGCGKRVKLAATPAPGGE